MLRRMEFIADVVERNDDGTYLIDWEGTRVAAYWHGPVPLRPGQSVRLARFRSPVGWNGTVGWVVTGTVMDASGAPGGYAAAAHYLANGEGFFR